MIQPHLAGVYLERFSRLAFSFVVMISLQQDDWIFRFIDSTDQPVLIAPALVSDELMYRFAFRRMRFHGLILTDNAPQPAYRRQIRSSRS